MHSSQQLTARICGFQDTQRTTMQTITGPSRLLRCLPASIDGLSAAAVPLSLMVPALTQLPDPAGPACLAGQPHQIWLSSAVAAHGNQQMVALPRLPLASHKQARGEAVPLQMSWTAVTHKLERVVARVLQVSAYGSEEQSDTGELGAQLNGQNFAAKVWRMHSALIAPQVMFGR